MILGFLEDFRERPGTQKLVAVTFFSVAALILDWNYIYGPRSETLAEQKSLLRQRQQELAQKEAKADNRATTERELKELAAELRRAESRLPNEREIADLLSSIAANARGVGLDITLFRQKPETYSDYYAEVPVQMEMRGTYHDLATFLDRVKRLDRIVNVSDIKLEKPELRGDRMVLKTSCTATTFRFLDEAERKALEEKRKNQKKGGDKSKDVRKGA